jgi:hypothetical protein
MAARELFWPAGSRLFPLAVFFVLALFTIRLIVAQPLLLNALSTIASAT